MDPVLFWSAPAKRRGRIELQRWGIPAAFAGNLGAEFRTCRGDGAFPWSLRLVLGMDALPNPKRRQTGTPRLTLRLRRASRIPAGTGVKLPPHSKTGPSWI